MAQYTPKVNSLNKSDVSIDDFFFVMQLGYGREIKKNGLFLIYGYM